MDEALSRLAAHAGVLGTYIDATGQRQVASPEAIMATLRGLGIPLHSPADAGELLTQLQQQELARLIAPVAVLWDRNGVVPFQVQASAAGPAELALHTEEGEVYRWSVQVEQARIAETVEVGSSAWVRRQFPLRDVPYGYHRLRVSFAGMEDSCLLICAPRQALEPQPRNGSHREWGVFTPLYSLHRKRADPAANLTDLGDMIDWVVEQGGSTVGTLPLLASFLSDPFEPSPYAPVSRLFWNELFLDVDALPEAPPADPNPEAPAPFRLQEDLLDYRGVMLHRRGRLQMAAEIFFAQGAPGLEELLRVAPDAIDYARFRERMEEERTGWSRWDPPLRPQANLTPGDLSAVGRYHLYVQVALHRQLQSLAARAQGKGGGLYLDLPLGVHADGYDTWRYSDLFCIGLAVGAPPDALFSGGQNWGFPPLNPRAQRAAGYDYFIGVIRNHLRYASLLRIDHAAGLHRLYCIPSGLSAKEGVYIRQHPEELYAILTLESHRSGAVLLGEDLGTVPPEVREGMGEHRIHRMHVQQFGMTPDPRRPLLPPAPRCVASLNTHDTPKFAAWWQGLDFEDQLKLGVTTPERAEQERGERQHVKRALVEFFQARGMQGESLTEITARALEYLGRSDAWMVLVDLEDLWGETRPQNVPGTGDGWNNWRGLARYSIGELQALPQVQEILSRLNGARRAGSESALDPSASPLTPFDLYLFNEGTHYQLYEKLGAHPATVGDEVGCRFAVWAPNAREVSVLGPFNGWQAGHHPLASRGASGIWEGFVPGVHPGELYKYHVVPRSGAAPREKADPFAQQAELPPRTASVVPILHYKWGDRAWMEKRREAAAHREPVSIYEVHLGSWRRHLNGDSLSYRELAPALIEHVKAMGFTHVELMPVMEHPFYGSWGYQVTSYFAPTARYGDPTDLKYLVDQLHQADIGVILDWVPSHFPEDPHGLAQFDGTHLYEHADPRQGFHPDWKSAIFNYGRNEVRSFLISSARYWLDVYHADGLRVDGVASMLYLDYSRAEGEWIPNEYGGRENLAAVTFLKRMNEEVYRSFPGVQTIAEESTAWPMVSRPTDVGGLGFGFKWDMGWMHDTLEYFKHDPVHRKYHHGELTFRMVYAWDENFVLSLSHDEVVHGKGALYDKMPGDDWQKRANLRLLYGYMWGLPGKKLLFMGQELGLPGEWNHDGSIDWGLAQDPRFAGIGRWVGDLNRLYVSRPALHQIDNNPDGFEWIESDNAEEGVLAFLRKSHGGHHMLVVLNLTPVPREWHRLGVPRGGPWRECLNSDAPDYGGSGIGNQGEVHADDEGWHGRPHSLRLRLPPLSAVFLEPLS